MIKQTMLTCRAVQNGCTKVDRSKKFDSVAEYVKSMSEKARGCILVDKRKRKANPEINFFGGAAAAGPAAPASASPKKRRIAKKSPKKSA
jgi:hypothetical protein